jgi:hypothetical protein
MLIVLRKHPLNQYCESGSGIRCLFDLGSGMGKKIRIRIRDKQPGSYFSELRNNFLRLKFFDADL